MFAEAKSGTTKVVVTLEPGDTGAVGELATGRIVQVFPEGQSARAGVEIGWRILSINGLPYSATLLKALVCGGCPYTVTFTKPLAESVARQSVSAATEESPEVRSCRVCGAQGRLFECGRCKRVRYCSKGFCMSREVASSLFSMGQRGVTSVADEEFGERIRGSAKAAKNHRPSDFKRWVSRGVALEGGCPLSEPPGFALYFEDAYCEFLSAGMKGERAYRALFEDMRANLEDWLGFFKLTENKLHTNHACGILGNYATLLRQRGDLEQCGLVLAMEKEVLRLYDLICASACPWEQPWCDSLQFKYNIIRYNLGMQTKDYQECIHAFRQLAAFELHMNYDFEQQSFLILVAGVLNKTPSAHTLDQLRDDEVMTIIETVAAQLEGSPLLGVQEKSKLKVCAGCGREEDARGDFKSCSRCKTVRYCSTDCQKAHWRHHKKDCNNT